MRKDHDEVERLLDSGVCVNAANEDGLTAIHQCCIDDSVSLLRLLVEHGGDVNACDNDLWTPLHAAATCANQHICKLLIASGADLLAVNTDGNMPYDICDDEACLEYIESEMAARGITQHIIDMKRRQTELCMLEDVRDACREAFEPHAALILAASSAPAMLKAFLGSLATAQPHTPNNNNSNNNYFLTAFYNVFTRDGRLDLNAKDANGATLVNNTWNDFGTQRKKQTSEESLVFFILFDRCTLRAPTATTRSSSSCCTTARWQ